MDCLLFQIFIHFWVGQQAQHMHTLLDYFPECDLEMGQMHQDVSTSLFTGDDW